MINSEKNKLPSGWSKTGFNDISDVVMGQSPPSSTYNKDGSGLPFFQGKAEFQDLYPSIEKYCSVPNKIAQKGAVLMSVRAPVGPTNIAPEKCCIGRGLAAFHPLGGISTSFLLYLIRSIERELAKDGTGTTFSAINKQYIEEVRFGLPPLEEQHRIVAKIEELFSELDKGIESLKRAREQLKVYRQALLKHAFEGKLTEQWREDNAGKLETDDQLLERIKQEREARYQQQLEEWKAAVKQWEESGKNGKKPSKPRNLPTVKPENEGKLIEGLPKSWHCLKLLDITLSLGQGWSPKCNNIPAGESEWGVIKTTAIQHLNYLEEENKQLPAELVPRPWLSIQQDDILITRAGPRSRVGVVCRVSETRDKLMLCDKAYRMQFPESEISPAYVESLLNTEDFKRKIESLKTGISDSGVNITQPRLLGLYFPVPPIEEQLEIGRLLDQRLSVIERNILDIDEALGKSEALRQSILKKAFSGQLVPQDPDDEPASLLLDRIAKEKEEAAAKAKKAKAAKRKTKKGGSA